MSLPLQKQIKIVADLCIVPFFLMTSVQLFGKSLALFHIPLGGNKYLCRAFCEITALNQAHIPG